jgi:hypothetical protein
MDNQWDSNGASKLPPVYPCNPSDGQTIYDQTRESFFIFKDNEWKELHEENAEIGAFSQ